MQRRPMVRLTATLALAAVMAVIAAMRADPHGHAAPVQLVANPYFADWAGGVPASWSLSGSATAAEVLDSHDAVRAGPNPAAIVTAASDGDGLFQGGLPVTPGARYDVYAWVRAPGSGPANDFQLRVTGGGGAPYLAVAAYNETTPNGWHRLQATFVVGAGESSVQLAFVRSGSGAPLELWLDDVALYERVRDLSASKVPTPARPVILYGLEQDIERVSDAAALSTFNVFDAFYQTPTFVSGLRDEGKVAAKRVYVPDVGVEELVARWTEPFRDTMEGRLPQGFDAIIIDEFGGWLDSSTKANTVADALQRTKSLYPNRQIYVWGDWRLASGSSYDRVLSAINATADVFILEAYAHELLPQYGLASTLAQGIRSREQANPAIAGLLGKTVFGLALYQTPDTYTADNNAEIDFKAFLDEHFHGIANDPIAGAMRGVGLFAYQYAPADTIEWFGELVAHYVERGQRGYLKAPANSPVGRHASLLADGNPSFEVDGGSWRLSGTAAYGDYAGAPNVLTYHGSFRSPVPHGTAFLQMHKTTEQGSLARQSVAVQPSTTYVLNAYALGPTGSTSAEIGVAGLGLKQSAAYTVGSSEWTKVGLLFTTPPSLRSIAIRLSDRAAPAGGVTYWDYVELTEKSTFDVFMPSVTAEPTSLTIHWVSDLPSLGEVRYSGAGGTFTAQSNNGLATRHEVVLSGLSPASFYRFETLNRTPGSSPVTFTSPEYGAYTRTSTGHAPHASPIPPDVVAPDPPVLQAAVFGEGGVKLEWEDYGYDVLGFDVYRSATPDGPLTKINDSLVRESSYIDPEPTADVRYYYAITAVDAAGNESAFSNRVLSVPAVSRTYVPFIARD